MYNEGLSKGEVHSLGKIIEYAPDGIVSKTLLKKPTGTIDLIAYDTGTVLAGKIYPFDTFVLLLEGKAELTMDEKTVMLTSFQGTVIPANTAYKILAVERFRMLSVTIKSGYE